MSLPIQRLRLETDRLLRSRAFFARAVLGRLHEVEYAALLHQLTALIDVASHELARDLVAMGREDVALLAGTGPGDEGHAPCPTISLVRGAMLEGGRRLSLDAAHDLALVVLGTSWAADAATTLARPFPLSTRLLDVLSARAADSMKRMTIALARPASEAQEHLAFAEFMRGALLGLSTYLDSRWPAPCGHRAISPGAVP